MEVYPELRCVSAYKIQITDIKNRGNYFMPLVV
jgi:hypothetical protein